jgi:uncharacterized protein (TIGR02058 family)
MKPPTFCCRKLYQKSSFWLHPPSRAFSSLGATTCQIPRTSLPSSKCVRSPEIRCFTSGGWSDATSQPERPAWSSEWKRLGLGAQLVDYPSFPTNLFFVELGFGVDQHGDRTNATKAAIRAVRNAIEFNSIPGVIRHIPGGRNEMLIHLKLGVPSPAISVDVLEVAKVFPYGKLLPIEISVGGLEFATGRVVEELGDSDDIGICVAACISIGYEDDDDPDDSQNKPVSGGTAHNTFSTKDGY